MIARLLAIAIVAACAACAPRPAPMDWKGLADYLDKQERAE